MAANKTIPKEKKSKKAKWLSEEAVGNGTSLQYSCLENSKGRGAWWV